MTTTTSSPGTEGTSTYSSTAYRDREPSASRVCWGSILAGAVTALAIQLVLALIGLAIGLSTIDPAQSDTPSGSAIGIGAMVWWVISSLVSLYIGGYVAGRLAGSLNGFLHGIVTWASVTLITIMLLSGAAGRLVSGASGIAKMASNAEMPAGIQLPPQVQSAVDQAQSQAQQKADQAAAQAQATANDPQARQQAEQKAKEVGEKAAEGGAAGSFGAALALILGAAAAGIGGKSGHRPSPLSTTSTVHA
ncbi:MAG TPA: hypothetical protein VF614_03235 [Chthoniobacteraceae bacterium]|jgi:hypothetical protein